MKKVSCNSRSLQGVSGGKVNILGSDSICHCERKSSYELVSSAEYLNLQVQ